MLDTIVYNFHYIFFPCCFNALLRIESDDFLVERAYGTPFDSLYLEASSDVIS